MSGENPQSVDHFLERVKNQIRSKEARVFVEQELQAHIEQRKKEYMMHDGYSQEEAEKLTINHMGNPVLLGKEMHKIHKPKVDWFVIGLFTLLLIMGTVPFYYFSFESSDYFFSRKIVYSLISIVIVIGLMFSDYRKIIRLWPFWFSIALVLSLFITFYGDTRKGQGYLFTGFISIDFWFISTLFIISFVGMIQTFHRERIRLWISIFVMFWLPILFFHYHIYLPVAIFYFLTLLLVMAFSPIAKEQLRQMFLIKGIFSLTVLVFLLFNINPHQRMRIEGFLDPEAYQNGSGYISFQLQGLFQEATLLGQGVSAEFMGLIPDMHTDLIFASLVAHFGWLFGALLISSIGLILLRMLYTINKTKDRLGIMVVTAGVSVIGLAAVWNICMVLGFLPIMGIPLPFFSYGGQFQVIYSVYIGLILSVYRRKDLVQLTVDKSA